ncbi:MAG: STAS domain-containing protein [Minicystis sp.]
MQLTAGTTVGLEERVARIESILAQIASGDFTQMIPLGDEEDSLATVEVGINFMVQDLRDLFAANKAQEAKLAAQRQELEEGLALLALKQAMIVALSTPVIQVWKDVLCLPIVGAFEPTRAAEMRGRLLEAVDRTDARGLIIDVTGIEQIDTACASHLVKAIKTVRLLGCEALISGIRPSVADTLVELGADFGGIATRKNLWEGLRYFIDERPEADARVAAPDALAT